MYNVSIHIQYQNHLQVIFTGKLVKLYTGLPSNKSKEIHSLAQQGAHSCIVKIVIRSPKSPLSGISISKIGLLV